MKLEIYNFLAGYSKLVIKIICIYYLYEIANDPCKIAIKDQSETILLT